MMADCRAGKVDRILVKSMSRFARNTSDFLLAMRELTRLEVTIRFGKEHIDTGKLTSEQTATIYAGFAQMESTNHSSNMRTSVRMRMERGIFTPSSMPYGYRLHGLELGPIQEEANISNMNDLYYYQLAFHGLEFPSQPCSAQYLPSRYSGSFSCRDRCIIRQNRNFSFVNHFVRAGFA